MGQTTKIEWADATWTPLQARRRDTGKTGVHCVKVSEECKNCYSERHNQRSLPAHGTGLPFTVLSTEKVEMFLNPDILEHPLRWRKPRTIFVNSQTDTFGEFVSDELIDRQIAVMARANWHRYLVLTKRAKRMHDYFNAFKPSPPLDGFITRGGKRHDETTRNEFVGSPGRWPLPNVWLGVTAGTQKSADERIPWLLKTPAAKRFLSAEPLLEAIDIRNYLKHPGMPDRIVKPGSVPVEYVPVVGLDWAIAGGESGPGARPMHPNWARSLRDQCVAAGTAFHFKQWGEWSWTYDPPTDQDLHEVDDSARYQKQRVGKHSAGRLLDGREWNEVPNA